MSRLRLSITLRDDANRKNNRFDWHSPEAAEYPGVHTYKNRIEFLSVQQELCRIALYRDLQRLKGLVKEYLGRLDSIEVTKALAQCVQSVYIERTVVRLEWWLIVHAPHT
jgi:hypothetical protein